MRGSEKATRREGEKATMMRKQWKGMGEVLLDEPRYH